MIDMEQFAKERDAALLSLNKKKIEGYMRKYDVHYHPSNELVFWASVHKAILAIKSATPAQKLRSAQWLREHGFKADNPLVRTVPGHEELTEEQQQQIADLMEWAIKRDREATHG